MDTQKKSPRDSAKSEMKSAQAQPSQTHDNPTKDFSEDRYDERYMDRSLDHVARVRAAREAAQRRMEEFGDVSEYDVTIIHGQLKKEPGQNSQSSLDLKHKGEN